MSQQVFGGRYRVEETLGRGGMATVFKGTDTVLGRPVAIKVLAPQFSQDQAFVDRFRREAQAAARLNHPNLVGVYDTGSDDGAHFIVMEYVEGRTLEDFMEKGGRLMPERAVELAETVCGALAYAHAQGVVHRDIKPGNIMVTRRGEVKVMDFGIARMTTTAETVAQTAAVLGTAAYLSPEQAKGQAVDGRSDLYSLGVVLYEMLAGRQPFIADSAVAVAYKHVQEIPEPPSKYSPEVTPPLEAVVMRALAKNPANRYQTAEDFESDLRRAASGQPVQATPLLLDASAPTEVIDRAGSGTAVLPPQTEPGGGGRARRWIVGIVVGLLVLGALGGGLYLLAQKVLKSNDVAKVNVLNVVGLTRPEAISRLTRAGFKVDSRFRTRFSPKPVDTVLATDPPVGTPIDKATQSVTLIVSKGPKQIPVPSVVGKSQADAVTAITDAGLTLGSVTPEASDKPAGQVISQTPDAGTPVDKGTPVDLVVSEGQQTGTVPDVTCESLGQAKHDLTRAGFSPSLQGTRPANPACPHGNKVALQDPAGFTEAQLDTTVKIWTNAPPSPTPSPSAT